MIFKAIKIFFNSYSLLKKEQKVFNSEDYYKDVNEIPLFNWWNCSKGDYKFLWKKGNSWVPSFFKTIYESMYFQLDYIDLSELRKIIETNIYESKYLITKDIKYKRKADTKRAEIEAFNRIEKTETKLNNLIKFVQMTLNLNFFIDPKVISAGTFLSYYNEAISKLEHGNN